MVTDFTRHLEIWDDVTELLRTSDHCWLARWSVSLLVGGPDAGPLCYRESRWLAA